MTKAMEKMASPRFLRAGAAAAAPPRPASAAALGPKSAQVALAGSQPLPLRKGTGEFGAAERQRATIESGDLLVKAPNVFRGVAAEKLEPTGVLQGLPLLSKEEEVKVGVAAPPSRRPAPAAASRRLRRTAQRE